MSNKYIVKDGYVIDQYGAKASIEFWGSEENAKEVLSTLSTARYEKTIFTLRQALRDLYHLVDYTALDLGRYSALSGQKHNLQQAVKRANEVYESTSVIL